VNRGVDFAARKQPVQRRRVAHVGLQHGAEFAPGEPFHPFERHRRRVGIVVDDRHLIPAAQQGETGVRTDVAGAAGDEDGGHGVVLVVACRNRGSI